MAKQQKRGPWPGRFVWFDLMTTDGHRAQAFYTSLFGWRIEERNVHGFLYREIHAACGQIGGILHEPGVPLSNWLPYVAVEDVDATAAKCRELGGSQRVPPRDIPGVGRFAVLADAEGATFAAYRGNEAHPGTDPEMTMAGCVCWNELWTRDAQKAQRFYGALLGWRSQGLPMEPMGTYHLQFTGEQLAAGIMENPDPQTRPCWATYFQVDQLGVSTQKALQQGAKRWAGPIELPGIGTFTLITDPTGAMLALFQQPAAPA